MMPVSISEYNSSDGVLFTNWRTIRHLASRPVRVAVR
jgi:hypothetical protein